MSVPSRLAVIINPISGGGGRPDVARRRAELAASRLTARGIDAQIFVTERVGHARALAAASIREGASTVVAWGGDGTVNEVASVVAFTDTRLAIVPSGSGNGLARGLGIPFAAPAALDVAMGSSEQVIDAGELDGRLFVNVAGVGLDARVAHRFAADGLVRRGFLRYAEITAQELLRYKGEDHTVVVEGRPRVGRMLLIAVANARQYGNGAIIAPRARLDDGRLDVVIVYQRSRVRTILEVPRLFLGQIARIPHVDMIVTTDVEITSGQPVVYHVDGEPFVGGASIRGRVLPRALRVKVR